MRKTRYTGVLEHEAKDGTITFHIRYTVGGKTKREALGIKGAMLGDIKLDAKTASLIRADRMTQVARNGEEVLRRGKSVPTLGEVWRLHEEDKAGTAGLSAARFSWKYIERWADHRLDEITEREILAARNEWRTDPAYHTRFNKPPAEATINHALKLLLQLFKLAKGRELFFGRIPLDMKTRNSNGKVKLKTNKQLDNVRDRYLSADEAQKILEWCNKHDQELGLQVKLLLCTGARLAEICGDTRLNDQGLPKHHGLRWMDVDLEGKSIYLQRKGRKYHTLPVTDDVVEILKGVGCQEPSARVTGYRFKRESWNQMIKDLGFNPKGTHAKKKVTAHTLRHTFATWYLEEGGDIKNLSWLMNHSSIEITARYLHLDTEIQRRSSAGITRRLKAAQRSHLKVVNG